MATWLMKKDEVKKLHKLIQDIITPTNYGPSLRSAFNVNGKIIGFKTHNYHNFMKVLISYYIFHIFYRNKNICYIYTHTFFRIIFQLQFMDVGVYLLILDMQSINCHYL